MELQKIDIDGIDNMYVLSVVLKEFEKSVGECWKEKPPWKRYQKKLIGNLAVLSDKKEKAIYLPQYELLSGEDNLYSIRYPNAGKNVRVLYTIADDQVIILLTAFLETTEGDYRNAIRVAKRRIQWLESD